jgi:hypothetical protein
VARDGRDLAQEIVRGVEGGERPECSCDKHLDQPMLSTPERVKKSSDDSVLKIIHYLHGSYQVILYQK